MSDTRFYTGRGGSDPRAADALPTVDPKAMRAPDFYRATAQTAAAVDVALTLGMPLLLTGEPGSGKSGLADSIAWELGLGEVLRFPVKSGTESRDLFYRFFCFTDLTMAQALRIDPTWHPLIKGCPPRWVSEWGEDRHGVFVAFTLADITQRLRWIPAGAFRMGSPEDKPGRLDNEGPQHTVYIRRGFWRFDTPCTQGLWETVMDENPSRFQSPDRPVERVSWNDVQGFLEHINARIPGLELVLPTEAQWEHACRAGTDTALYTDPIDILGENNAPALDLIAWYGGNSGLDFELEEGADSSNWSEVQHPDSPSGTHPVGRKRPNPWGLYDMIGNVWEWCADGLRTYDADWKTDPVGPLDAGAVRVVRGGSWSGFAGLCRSASRGRNPPGYRNDYLGFRCARVQE